MTAYVLGWDSSAAASPFDLARSLAGRSGLAVLASHETSSRYGRFSYVACDPTTIVDDALDPLGAGDADAPDGFGHVPSFVGIIPYEATRARLERTRWTPVDTRPRPLVDRIEWAKFDAVVVVDHAARSTTIVADDEPAAARLARKLEHPAASRQPFRLGFFDDEDPAFHVTRVERAIERIFAGDFYQANLARRIRVAIEPASPSGMLDAGEALLDASPTPFGVVLHTSRGAWVLSSTPELLLDASPSPDRTRFGRLVTEPIKGTRRRAASDPHADAELLRSLESDPKDHAELAMIIDVERNDLARVCAPGTVTVEEPARAVSHQTVHHRVARVAGTARDTASRAEVVAAMVPSGSVTGAPKVRAMEAIAELEPMRRGLYTGGFGYLSRDGSMRLAMAIRTAVVDELGQGEYLVGGGIVADSDPQLELEETVWKSAQIAAIGRQIARR